MSRRSPYPQIPQTKILKMIQIIEALKRSKMSLKKLAKRFDVSERTVYRYLSILDETDLLLEKDFNDQYFIATYQCPQCGTIHTKRKAK